MEAVDAERVLDAFLQNRGGGYVEAVDAERMLDAFFYQTFMFRKFCR